MKRIDRRIMHGDIFGIGILKINYLLSVGIETYADFDKIIDSAAYALPKFGIEAVTSFRAYISELKDQDDAGSIENQITTNPSRLDYFAGLAMQGILAKGDVFCGVDVAADSIAYACYLLEAIENHLDKQE